LKLFEHPDFEQAIIQTAKHFHSSGIREAIVEKDYYVTETLRLIQQTSGDRVIFKGGTSLSKGWGIIYRFSEDVDLFLDPEAFSPALGKNAIAGIPIAGTLSLGAIVGWLGRSAAFVPFGMLGAGLGAMVGLTINRPKRNSL